MAYTERTGTPTNADYRRGAQRLLGGKPSFQNKPPHPRLGRATPWGGAVQRGAIATLDHSEGKGIFYFHFNPESYSTSYSAVQIDPERQPLVGGGLPPPGAINIDYTLLLNRQYDMLTNRTPGGTLDDIEVLLKVVGNGVHLVDQKMVQMIFGPRTILEGYVTGLSVQHHQFTRHMIPVWTTVSLTLTNSYYAAEGEATSSEEDAADGGTGRTTPNSPPMSERYFHPDDRGTYKPSWSKVFTP